MCDRSLKPLCTKMFDESSNRGSIMPPRFNWTRHLMIRSITGPNCIYIFRHQLLVPLVCGHLHTHIYICFCVYMCALLSCGLWGPKTKTAVYMAYRLEGCTAWRVRGGVGIVWNWGISGRSVWVWSVCLGRDRWRGGVGFDGEQCIAEQGKGWLGSLLVREGGSGLKGSLKGGSG